MLRLTKRGGALEKFAPEKIKRALLLAFNAVGEVPNVAPLVRDVMERLRNVVQDKTVDVEQVQDAVESILMDAGHHNVARRYIVYRHERAMIRAKRSSPDKWALPNYIHAAKYARYRSDLGRREIYSETVDRCLDMHISRLHKLPGAISQATLASIIERVVKAFGHVHRKEELPSMRSMQFAGAAIEADEARMFNCSFTLIDRWRSFQEIFYLLLCGCGVGYSVQWQHVEKLSPVLAVDKRKVRHFTIADDIKGWADAIGALVEAYTVSGVWIEFNYSLIRSEGTPLITSGGKAPGHLPLRRCLEAVRSILSNAAGRQLRPIEASDIVCHKAEAVLAGGIRRSSLIGLFSAHDTEMIYAKARGNFRPASGGDPGIANWRQMVNLSAALLRGSVHRSVFDRLIRVAQENFGDPGFIFLSDLDHGTNPCGEIGLNPVLKTECNICKGTGRFKPLDASSSCLRCKGLGFIRRTGFSFCNLCEINMATVTSEEDFLKRVEAAAIIGTLQASYTNFPYLGSITESIVKREALLGIGMAGIQNNRRFSMDADLLQLGAALAIAVNQEWAAKLNICSAARVTTVKPGGTAPLELGVIGSGIHPMWSRRYFQRITANINEPCAQEFRRVNPHMVDVKPDGDWSLVFPIEVDEGVRTVKEMSALSFLEDVLCVYKNWVLPGTARPESSVGLTHNVSCSVTIRDNELEEVCDRIWSERESITAMAFIPYSLDSRFAYAPRLQMEDEIRWERLIANYRAVDWSSFREESDETSFSAECTSQVCEIK